MRKTILNSILILTSFCATAPINAFAASQQPSEITHAVRLRVQEPSMAGYVCEIALSSDWDLKNGVLEFGSFYQNGTANDLGSTTRHKFNVTNNSEFKQIAKLVTSVRPGGSSALKLYAGTIDYDLISGEKNRVAEARSIYANTSVNQKVIKLMNRLCNKARVTFNAHHPDVAVRSLGEGVIQAEQSVSLSQSFFSIFNF